MRANASGVPTSGTVATRRRRSTVASLMTARLLLDRARRLIYIGSHATTYRLRTMQRRARHERSVHSAAWRDVRGMRSHLGLGSPAVVRRHGPREDRWPSAVGIPQVSER